MKKIVLTHKAQVLYLIAFCLFTLGIVLMLTLLPNVGQGLAVMGIVLAGMAANRFGHDGSGP